MPGLLDSELAMKLDIPDAAAVILDILSRETRYQSNNKSMGQTINSVEGWEMLPI